MYHWLWWLVLGNIVNAGYCQCRCCMLGRSQWRISGSFADETLDGLSFVSFGGFTTQLTLLRSFQVNCS